jgi:hypothetical protein
MLDEPVPTFARMSPTRSSSPRLVLTLIVALLVVAFPASAGAEISGAGPDENIGQAFGPLHLGVTYSGAFANPNDIDYLSFVVAKAGQTLQFTVRNTTKVCQDPYDAACPVYATLMDSTGQSQLGGSNSDAGTIATFRDTETFSWTFAQPGTYYVLMESDGDLAPGNPAYAITMGTPGSGTGSGGGGGKPAPLVKSLKVASHQRGESVKATIVLGQHVPWLRGSVLLRRAHRHPVLIVSKTLRHLAAGSHRVSIRLPRFYRRKLAAGKRLFLLLKLTVASTSGHRTTYTRSVILRG